MAIAQNNAGETGGKQLTPNGIRTHGKCSHLLLRQGKTRDIYELGKSELLMVATDRISAFDVVLPDLVPGKGKILTALSRFWFSLCRDIVPHHWTGKSPAEVLPREEATEDMCQRSLVVRRLKPLPIEAIVRGYLCGSGWRDYQASGTISGIALPSGLPHCGRLPEPIFTPTTKAPPGTHDASLGFQDMVAITGWQTADEVRKKSLEIYRVCSSHARERGIIIADTKLEFARDDSGKIVLIDELITPDSSRFWLRDSWSEGSIPPSLDKQLIRDYLENSDWNKSPPAPLLPKLLLANVAEAYQKIERMLLT